MRWRSKAAQARKEAEAAVLQAAGLRSRSRQLPAEPRPPGTPPGWLVGSAGWAWRLLVVALAVFLIFWALSKVLLAVIAVFIALVITAVLRPLVLLYARVLPRGAAAGLGLVSALLVIGGLVTFVVTSVTGSWQKLANQFETGVDRIITWLEEGPLPVTITREDVNQWLDDGRAWLEDHAGSLAMEAASQIGVVVMVFTCLALAIFCGYFFLARGESMWAWFLSQLPGNARDTWQRAGGAGWYTFSGYARGTVLLALIESILAGLFLWAVGVPLPGPLGVLVFVGGFIPMIGAPAAMLIATIVALAANGPVSALIVCLGIAGIGQIEGHILHPNIMGKQVKLHPVVVAIAVIGGTLIGGLFGTVISVPLVAVAWSVFITLRPPVEQEDEEATLETTDPDSPPATLEEALAEETVSGQ